MNVELPPDAIRFVKSLVASGEYPSIEEAVAEGVRLLMARQQLKDDIQAGIDDLDQGRCVDGKQVFAELRERARSLGDQGA